MTKKILVADPIAPDGVAILRKEAEVDVRTGMTPDELMSAIPAYHALVVRSETRVTRAVFAAAKLLQAVGRAGVGVDNIDLTAATERGVVVVNAPLGNTISAAEHAVGLMLALARHIPEANASLKGGAWTRSKFVGVELRGKTLGVIGLGQVGSEVARRGKGLDMTVVAHDPFVSPERAAILGVELAASLDDVLARADFLSLHTVLTAQTRHLIGAPELAKMRASARLINTARGDLVDVDALVAAIGNGQIAGAALDVFPQEPPDMDSAVLHNEKIIVTPHLGASTAEAQERVAVDVAAQVLAILRGEPAQYAVNAPMIAVETMLVIAPYIAVAEKVATLATQLAAGQMGNIEIEYLGEIAQHDTTALRAAVIKGLVAPISEENVTIVNAGLIAENRGMKVSERKGPGEDVYANLVRVHIHTTAGDTDVAGTVGHDGPHIVAINGLWVDIPPGAAWLLLCENQDRPGMIGAVGTFLGEHDINISFMRVGRTAVRGRALMAVGLDDPITPEQVELLVRTPNILSAHVTTFS
ncbi:MAG TPA: phosphoglycerate dehydrogenase [Dehalococcoidia bacterium]|nr:phosphoglycerate dehydrogenase [Dehalococcoidia bacterium]